MTGGPARQSTLPRLPIVDAHLDLAYNAAHGHDLRLSLADLRASEAGLLMAARHETPVVSLPALAEGDVAVVFGTIFVLPANAPGDLRGDGYTTPDEAYARALAQVEYYRSLERDGLIELIATTDGLAAHLDMWSALERSAPPGVVLLMEGADPIRTPSEVRHWAEHGLRIIGPAWTATRYSGGTAAPGPLTPLGRDLLREMDAAGLGLDVSHMADESFWEAMGSFPGAAMASHANCRSLVPGDRQLSDEMIRALVDRDGVIGVVLYNRFLDADWTPAHGKHALRLERVVHHIEHICDIARDARHAGIGTDFDGGFGREAIPAELDSCVDLPAVGRALQETGWGHAEIAGVLGGNWLRWLAQTLPRT